MNIHYFSEDIDFSLSNSSEQSDWISSIIINHNYDLQELNYIFCSDEYLLAINKEHLDHDYYTDIITFDNSDKAGVIESDIFISVDRVKENASNQNTTFKEELNRVMIHGVLHLLGFGDKSEEEKKVMREKEDACLSLLNN
ncbi:rRNA maturation RNase YbeY [Ekhidna sp.]|uniref:rRNA maturation RNase YbeY n=1 Tax=Ekhidna sp. TaxID=2608089 RepID=UPI003CCBDAE6